MIYYTILYYTITYIYIYIYICMAQKGPLRLGYGIRGVWLIALVGLLGGSPLDERDSPGWFETGFSVLRFLGFPIGCTVGKGPLCLARCLRVALWYVCLKRRIQAWRNHQYFSSLCLFSTSLWLFLPLSIPLSPSPALHLCPLSPLCSLSPSPAIRLAQCIYLFVFFSFKV